MPLRKAGPLGHALESVEGLFARHCWLRTTLSAVYGILFLSAVVGVFLSDRYPFLKPFVWWTLCLSLAVPFGSIVVMALVVMPGIYVARSIIDHVKDDQASPLEERLTRVWSSVAGASFSLTIGVFVVLICFGALAEVKMWFVALCYMAILSPWLLLGVAGRKIIRRVSPPSEAHRQARQQRHMQRRTVSVDKQQAKGTRRLNDAPNGETIDVRSQRRRRNNRSH